MNQNSQLNLLSLLVQPSVSIRIDQTILAKYLISSLISATSYIYQMNLMFIFSFVNFYIAAHPS